VKTVKTTGYEKLALFYDLLMQGIDYEAWTAYVEELISRSQGEIYSVLDLACGTGNSTIPWLKRGYRVTGLDLSDEMLNIARRKTAEQGYRIDFRQGDLRCFRLPDQVDLAVCFQDGFNYVLDLKDLQSAFQSVYRSLNEGGFFVFDLNYLPRLLAENEELFTAEEDGYSLSWRTKYIAEEQLWKIHIEGKIKGDRGEQEEYFSEIHKEKIYDGEDIVPLLSASGFTGTKTYRSFTFYPPDQRTPRVVYLAQKSVPEE